MRVKFSGICPIKAFCNYNFATLAGLNSCNSVSFTTPICDTMAE